MDIPNNFAKSIIARGGELTPLLLNSHSTNGTGTTNPSILVDGDRVIVNVRHVEYTLYHSELKKYTHPWGPIVYLHKEDEMVLKTNNYLGVVGECDFEKVDTSLLDTTPVWEFIGLEDARLVKWEDKLYLSGVRRDTLPNGQGRMELSEIEPQGEKYVEVKRSRLPAPNGDKSYCEKNWMPILDMPFHYVKWCNPTEVVKVDPHTLKTEVVYLGTDKIDLSHDLRGGSQVIPYGKDYRLAIVHQVDLYLSQLNRKDATYRSRFVVWDREWSVVHVSNPFDFLGGRVEFVCGAAWSPEGEDLMVTFGYQDNSAYLIKITREYLDEILDLIPKKTHSRPRVIDCFPYFNEKELMELRIETLKDVVDEFIILEGDTTYTGAYKGFTVEKTIKELGLSKENIRVIKVSFPQNIEDEVTDFDYLYACEHNTNGVVSSQYWCRERLQRDSLQSALSEYNDDDVFIVSDCDEIVRPEAVRFIAENARTHKDKVIKIPMESIYGRADLQVFNKSGNPVSWEKYQFACTCSKLKGSNIQEIRNNSHGAEVVYLTQDGEVIKDLGWHFSWMGGLERYITKARAFSHARDRVDNMGFGQFNTLEMHEFMATYVAKEGSTAPLGEVDTVLKKYPLNKLPDKLFTIPRVKNYLLPPDYSVPVMGTAIVNGAKWLKRLVSSIDYPVDELFIVNNNGRGELDEEIDRIIKEGNPLIKNIRVCSLPGNIGCAGAWNLIIKSYLTSPYWIIVNHDIQLGPGLLEEMVMKAKDMDVGMIHGEPGDRGRGMYDLFLIKDWVVDKFGLFDENFYPGYAEDVDYEIRLRRDPNSTPKIITNLDSPYTHGGGEYRECGSQTWRTDMSLKPQLYKARELNESEYMARKWGVDWGTSPHLNPSTPLTSFELNFARRKHLGF
jgi:beta-1,4-mannosyl-glycoprotein beta-1,4-N-acetylglucosaminyltransferase